MKLIKKELPIYLENMKSVLPIICDIPIVLEDLDDFGEHLLSYQLTRVFNENGCVKTSSTLQLYNCFSCYLQMALPISIINVDGSKYFQKLHGIPIIK